MKLYVKCDRCNGTGWSKSGDLANPSWCAECSRGEGYIAVEPDRRICEQHSVVHKDENMRCFLSTELGSSVPCRWVSVVRVPKDDDDV